MIRPAAPEVLLAVYQAFRAADDLAGEHAIRASTVDCDEFVTGTLTARIAFLARIGAHQACIAGPARQAELVQVSHEIAEGFNATGIIAFSSSTTRVPRTPVRCCDCHERIEDREVSAA